MGDTRSRRTDDQLFLLMDDTAEWEISGRAAVALGLRHSLRRGPAGRVSARGRGPPCFSPVCSFNVETQSWFSESKSRALPR